MNSFGAHFCEVAVDVDLGVTSIRRFLSVMNCGRIINPKLAKSQYIGAMTMGIGMAMMEGNAHDPSIGNWIQADLADYHVPVYADTHSMEVIWLEEPDFIANPLGARASERWVSSAQPRRSPTRSSMPQESGSGTSR